PQQRAGPSRERRCATRRGAFRQAALRIVSRHYSTVAWRARVPESRQYRDRGRADRAPAAVPWQGKRRGRLHPRVDPRSECLHRAGPQLSDTGRAECDAEGLRPDAQRERPERCRGLSAHAHMTRPDGHESGVLRRNTQPREGTMQLTGKRTFALIGLLGVLGFAGTASSADSMKVMMAPQAGSAGAGQGAVPKEDAGTTEGVVNPSPAPPPPPPP